MSRHNRERRAKKKQAKLQAAGKPVAGADRLPAPAPAAPAPAPPAPAPPAPAAPAPAAPAPADVGNVLVDGKKKGKRRFVKRQVLWVKNWAKTAKPNEWATVGVTGLTAIAALIGAVLFYHSNLWETRKAEVEIKKSEVAIKETKMAMEYEEYKRQKAKLDADIVIQNEKWRVKEVESNDLNTEFGRLKSEVLSLRKELSEAARKNIAYLANEEAMNVLKSYIANESTPSGLDVVCRLDIYPDFMNVHLTGKGTLGFISSRDKNRVLSAVTKLKGKIHLYLENIELTEGDLVALGGNPSYQTISLVSCGITDQIVRKLVVNQHVWYLSLEGNKITRLPIVTHAWSLYTLDLANTKVDDKEMVPFLKDAINLYSVDLSNTDITDQSVDSIRKAKTGSDNIKLAGCAVGAESIKRLIERTKAYWLILSYEEKLYNDLKQYFEAEMPECIAMFGQDPNDPNKIVERLGDNGRHVNIWKAPKTLHYRPREIIAFKAGD